MDNRRVALQTGTGAAAERLRLRYPRSRLPRPVLITGVTVLAVAFLGWLVWAAGVSATPAVSGQVTSYHVVSDQEVAVTLTVDRPDPTRAAVCSVVAQAADFQSVGAMEQVQIPPRKERIVDVTFRLKTLRKATSASVKSCSVP